jgi:DNA-binding MarR family transcriptional regulator
VKPPSAEELATVAALRIAVRRFLAATDEATTVNGLTPRQYDLLALLHSRQTDQPLTPTAISSLLSLSRSATTELLGRAVAAGLVTRANPAEDGRTKHVMATRAGTRQFLKTVVDLRAERGRLLALLETATVLANDLSPVEGPVPSRRRK